MTRIIMATMAVVIVLGILDLVHFSRKSSKTSSLLITCCHHWYCSLVAPYVHLYLVSQFRWWLWFVFPILVAMSWELGTLSLCHRWWMTKMMEASAAMHSFGDGELSAVFFTAALLSHLWLISVGWIPKYSMCFRVQTSSLTLYEVSDNTFVIKKQVDMILLSSVAIIQAPPAHWFARWTNPSLMTFMGYVLLHWSVSWSTRPGVIVGFVAEMWWWNWNGCLVQIDSSHRWKATGWPQKGIYLVVVVVGVQKFATVPFWKTWYDLVILFHQNNSPSVM